jgi:hypothetical protein
MSVTLLLPFSSQPSPDRYLLQLRLLNGFRFTLKSQRYVQPTTRHIFMPMVTASSAPLLEIDFNLHKTNSSYFTDLDVSRTHLVCTLFAKGIEKLRGGTGAYTGTKSPPLGLALGAVSCNFRREVLPYQGYEVWSRVLTWDEKWVYIVAHFVQKPSTNSRSAKSSPSTSGASTPSNADAPPVEKAIFATAFSRCVWKQGRKTVAPEEMFRASGLIPATGEVPIEVEAQRLRGLEIATVLGAEGQRALEAQFHGHDEETLARHRDGTGIGGVVGTLLQLAHVKRKGTF